MGGAANVVTVNRLFWKRTVVMVTEAHPTPDNSAKALGVAVSLRSPGRSIGQERATAEPIGTEGNSQQPRGTQNFCMAGLYRH